jgi:hypothetical protein
LATTDKIIHKSFDSSPTIVEEYCLDGSGFEGVINMMYKHPGIGTRFSGEYHGYFGGGHPMIREERLISMKNKS